MAGHTTHLAGLYLLLTCVLFGDINRHSRHECGHGIAYGARHLVTTTFVQTPIWWGSVMRGVSGGSTCAGLPK